MQRSVAGASRRTKNVVPVQETMRRLRKMRSGRHLAEAVTGRPIQRPGSKEMATQ
jgi:hypothetical protein